MAEIVYKKISELDTGTVPLDGGELIMVSQTGVSKKATISNAHGAGWWNVLKVALSSFVAPNATHAVDSDTCGEESPSDFHDAAQLTGNIHLDRIPEELTGKNADTVDTYHVTTTGDGIKAKHGYVHGAAVIESDIFDAIAPAIPNTNDWITVSGARYSNPSASFIYVISKALRTSSSLIELYYVSFNSAGTGSSGTIQINDGSSTTFFISLAW